MNDFICFTSFGREFVKAHKDYKRGEGYPSKHNPNKYIYQCPEHSRVARKPKVENGSFVQENYICVFCGNHLELKEV